MKRLTHPLADAVDRLRRRALERRGAQIKRIQTAQGALSMVELKGAGPLPPVLFIHGLSAKCTDFDRVMMRLLPECQSVSAIDLPGHGWSEVPKNGMGHGPFLEMLFSAAGSFLKTPHHLVGSSLGGLMSVRLSQHLPDQIRSLALIAPGGTMATQEQLNTILRTFDVERWDRALAFVDACMGENPSIRRLMALAIQSRMAKPSIQALLKAFTPEWLLKPEELSAIAPPVLLYWGLQDGILGDASFSYYKAHLPKESQIHTVATEGHAPWLDGPRLDGSATFTAPLLKFWRGLEGA